MGRGSCSVMEIHILNMQQHVAGPGAGQTAQHMQTLPILSGV